ncbi:hypothetical protein GCM10009789_22140 [Kribbella sancticallisti]|uniref:Uncharacterized protein n=1 Tax=Kribbella sancticallisti TaxID=460087 RepID=A0ABP4NUW8_9ACTN
MPELARAWKLAAGSRRPVVPLRLPGKVFRGYAEGAAMPEGTPYGRKTFEQFLTERFGAEVGR